MTMTYDGTMVMPKNYAVVTEDEMTYVDGGLYINNLNCNKIWDIAAAVCGISTIAIGLTAIKAKIAGSLVALSFSVGAFSAATVIGIAVAAFAAGVILAQGVSFFDGIYTAKVTGTGCDFTYSNAKLQKNYY